MANVSRRGFLKFLGAAVPIAAVAPTYFLPPIGGWKSDVIVNPNTTPNWSQLTPQQIMADINYLIEKTYLESANLNPHFIVSGYQLDQIGRLNGVSRKLGETDESMRNKVQRRINEQVYNVGRQQRHSY